MENCGGRRPFFSTFSMHRPISNDSFETDHWKQLYIEYSRTGYRNNFRVAPVNQSKENAVDSLFSRPDVPPIESLAESASAVRQHLS